VEPHEHIEELGWRQGKFLPPGLVALAAPLPGPAAAIAEGEALMVVSQSCDLVHRSFENEPSCEVLLFRRVEKRNSRRSYGENPRFLQIALSRGGKAEVYEAAARGRYFVPRIELANQPPSAEWSCHPDDIELVTAWLAKRYQRPALPSAFNLRLKPNEKAIDNLLDRKHELLTDILLRLDSYDELPPEKPYGVRLLLVAQEEVLRDPERRDAVSALRDELGQAFAACAGVALDEVQLLSDTRTPWALVRSYVELDFDYLTVRDDSDGK
jgi:hypothetical protein